jgi:hypothetical protein
VEKKSRYNGFANYETWAVALWLGNDYASYHQWRTASRVVWAEAQERNHDRESARVFAMTGLADLVKTAIERTSPLLTASMYADLLQAALSEVDWYEIAEEFLTDVIEETSQ